MSELELKKPGCPSAERPHRLCDLSAFACATKVVPENSPSCCFGKGQRRSPARSTGRRGLLRCCDSSEGQVVVAPGAETTQGVAAEMGDEAELLQRVACWVFQALRAGNVARWMLEERPSKEGVWATRKATAQQCNWPRCSTGMNCCPHTFFFNVSQEGPSAVTKASAPKSFS